MHLTGVKPHLGEVYTALVLKPIPNQNRFVIPSYTQATHKYPFVLTICKGNIAYFISLSKKSLPWRQVRIENHIKLCLLLIAFLSG